MSVIIPLLNTTPLFRCCFSALFLRKVETVNAADHLRRAPDGRRRRHDHQPLMPLDRAVSN